MAVREKRERMLSVKHSSPLRTELELRATTLLRRAALVSSLAALLGIALLLGCDLEVNRGPGEGARIPCVGPAPICPAEGCTGNASFVDRFDGGYMDGAHAIAIDATGQVVVAGVVDGPVDLGDGLMAAGGLMAKFGPTGTKLWAKTFPGAEINAVAFDAAGGLVVGGSRKAATDLGGGTLSGNLFVAAFDADGNHVWSRAGVGSPELADLALDSQGNIAFVAETAYWFAFGMDEILPVPTGPSLLVGLLDQGIRHARQ